MMTLVHAIATTNGMATAPYVLHSVLTTAQGKAMTLVHAIVTTNGMATTPNASRFVLTTAQDKSTKAAFATTATIL